MSTRLRTLAALLALFAFSASLAEPAWASACAPAEAASTAAAPGHAAHGHPSAPVPGHAPRGHTPAPVSGCPVHAAASAGCTLLLLPAAAAAPPAPDAARGQDAPPAADALPDLLLASGPFRPPQR